jgi:hypothetical protein
LTREEPRWLASDPADPGAVARLGVGWLASFSERVCFGSVAEAASCGWTFSAYKLDSDAVEPMEETLMVCGPIPLLHPQRRPCTLTND